jgi:hypothetical protein
MVRVEGMLRRPEGLGESGQVGFAAVAVDKPPVVAEAVEVAKPLAATAAMAAQPVAWVVESRKRLPRRCCTGRRLFRLPVVIANGFNHVWQDSW